MFISNFMLTDFYKMNESYNQSCAYILQRNKYEMNLKTNIHYKLVNNYL